MYGHRVVDEDDPYVELAIEFMEASTTAITGRWVVDFFPFSKFILARPDNGCSLYNLSPCDSQIHPRTGFQKTG
jgi:hypothetical protein